MAARDPKERKKGLAKVQNGPAQLRGAVFANAATILGSAWQFIVFFCVLCTLLRLFLWLRRPLLPFSEDVMVDSKQVYEIEGPDPWQSRPEAAG